MGERAGSVPLPQNFWEGLMSGFYLQTPSNTQIFHFSPFISLFMVKAENIEVHAEVEQGNEN